MIVFPTKVYWEKKIFLSVNTSLNIVRLENDSPCVWQTQRHESNRMKNRASVGHSFSLSGCCFGWHCPSQDFHWAVPILSHPYITLNIKKDWGDYALGWSPKPDIIQVLTFSLTHTTVGLQNPVRCEPPQSQLFSGSYSRSFTLRRWSCEIISH